jgi:putative ribonuclease BN
VFTVKYFINRFEGKNEDRYEDIFDNLQEEDRELLEKIRKNLLLENNTLLKNI